MPRIDDLYAVIPAGGSGTRLWPLSRKGNPKFLHPLTGTDRSLLQATVDRLLPLVAPERIYVVTGVAHAAAVASQLPDVPDGNIVVEPSPRDSAAAIALACGVVRQRDPEAIVGSFHADHLITDPEAFQQTVGTAVAGARAGQLMTIGVAPTRAETGYGYLECAVPPRPGSVTALASFREKPPAELAADYVASGRYLWNAGMFVWRADVFLDALARYQPDVAHPVGEIAIAWDTPAGEATLDAMWPTVTKIAVDYAVMEPAAADGLVSTVPGDFGWSDIGDFETVAQLFGRDKEGVRVVSPVGQDAADRVLALDTSEVVVVPSSGRLVATLGVQDLIVVDVDDAVLICARDRVQDVKKLTALLRERGIGSHV